MLRIIIRRIIRTIRRIIITRIRIIRRIVIMNRTISAWLVHCVLCHVGPDKKKGQRR